MRVLSAVFLAIALSMPALAEPNPPECPDTHYPCGDDSCCSR